MNRLLSILVTLFILFLVYLWINHLTQGPDQTPAEEIKTTEVLPTPDALPDGSVDGEATDEEPDGEDTKPTQVSTGNEETKSPSAKAEEKKEEKPATPVNKPPVKSEPKPAPVKETPKPQTTTSEAAGLHLVIAGNFLTRANAEERVKQLHKLGYPLAEVVNFELSEYHTACAGRYSDLNEARRVSKKIKEMHNIDTYVRLGN